MTRNIFPLILLFSLILPGSLSATEKPELPPKYKKWLEQEVVYIVTSKEEEVFRELETDKQRDLFIQEFWRQRDPIPGTPKNEFKEEHCRRIEYANKWFGRGTAKQGWKTERGRVYIILGEPIHRHEYIDGRTYPIELWFYQGGKDLEPLFYIMFFKRQGFGDYELYSPMRDGPNKLCVETSHEPWDPMGTQRAWNRFFSSGRDASAGGAAYEILYTISYELAQASISLIPGGSAIHPIESDKLLGKVNTYPQKKVDDKYAYEFLKDRASVEVSYSVYYIGNTSIVKILQDECGLFFVHYSIQPQNLSVEGYKNKYYSNIKISGRIIGFEGKSVFQYDKEYPLEFSKEQIKQFKLVPMAIQDSFPLIPGSYKFSLLLQNTISKEFTSFDKDIIIPEAKDIPQMSDLVLAFKEERDQGPLKSSFKFKEMRLYPCLRREFTPKDTLYLFFQVYGLSEALGEEGWIKYTFFKKGKQHYVKTRMIGKYGAGVNFLEEFSLKGFPPSRYGIRISVLDREKREVLFEEERFTVLSKVQARPWVQFKRYPGSGDPVYSFILGTQLLNKGEMERAEEELRKAYEMKPEREDFALAYARVLLGREANQDVKRVLNPFAEKTISDYSLVEILGQAHQGAGEYEEAISFFQKFISHEGASFGVLNSIGESYFQIGNLKEALRAWEKSLEINPNQAEIKKKIEEIKNKREKV